MFDVKFPKPEPFDAGVATLPHNANSAFIGFVMIPLITSPPAVALEAYIGIPEVAVFETLS